MAWPLQRIRTYDKMRTLLELKLVDPAEVRRRKLIFRSESNFWSSLASEKNNFSGLNFWSNLTSEKLAGR